MKRRTFLQGCAGGTLVLASNPSLEAQGAGGTLEEAFRNPPSAAYAKTWWHFTQISRSCFSPCLRASVVRFWVSDLLLRVSAPPR